MSHNQTHSPPLPIPILDPHPLLDPRAPVPNAHPSSLDQLPPEPPGGVVEGELLAAQVVDRRVALPVQEEVVVEADLLWLLLERVSQAP